MFNVNVDPAYEAAVRNFVWPDPRNCLPPSDDLAVDIKQITDEVANKIVTASNMKKYLNNVSLLNICYAVVQDQDRKQGIANTVSRIENASNEEKSILHHVFRKLAEMFVLLDEGDLKAETLLLGIHRVHLLASEKIIPLPQILTQEEAMARLLELSDKYRGKDLTEGSNQFLADVDAFVGDLNQQEEAK